MTLKIVFSLILSKHLATEDSTQPKYDGNEFYIYYQSAGINNGGFWGIPHFWHNDNLYPMCVALLIYTPKFTLQTWSGNEGSTPHEV